MITLDIVKKLEETLQADLISRDKYFNSAVLVSLVKIEGEYNFVFQKRAKHIRQGGEISFPGGGFDEDDLDFENTAVRETEEELGISRDKISVIGKLGTLVIPNGVIVEAYIGELDVNSLDELNINKTEVERLISVPVDFFLENEPRTYYIKMENKAFYCRDSRKELFFSAKELGLPARYHGTWKGRDREVYFFRYDGEIIWGITADLIIETIKLLKA